MAGGRRPSGRTAWSVFGIVFGSCLAVAGLVVVGFVVFLAVGLNNWGSNK